MSFRGGRGGRGGGGGGRGGGNVDWRQFRDRQVQRNQGNAQQQQQQQRSSPPRSPGVLSDNDDENLQAVFPLSQLAAPVPLHGFFRQKNDSNYPALRDLQHQQQWHLPLDGDFHVGQQASLMAMTVQPDPFAPPSQFSVRVPLVGYPASELLEGPSGVAFCDLMLRDLNAALHVAGNEPNVQSQFIDIAQPSPNIIQRNAVVIMHPQQQQQQQQPALLEIRLRVSLPGNGRRIDGARCWAMFERLRNAVARAVPLPTKLGEQAVATRLQRYREHIISYLDQEWLRTEWLGSQSSPPLCAFIPNGAILPRAAGNSMLPMPVESGAVPFESPSTLRCSVTLPHSKRTITGMGLPAGVTIFVGSAYHGKSTILRGLETAIYSKVPGDGREFVAVASGDAVKIRAEDRRSVSGVDISTMIPGLPNSKNFSTADASGSTSQSANIVEALAVAPGAGKHPNTKFLLIDEDSSAANALVRDPLMEQLVGSCAITPFSQLVTSLAKDLGVSVAIVCGASSAFFSVADQVLELKNYKLNDVTAGAREIVQRKLEQEEAEGKSEAKQSGGCAAEADDDGANRSVPPARRSRPTAEAQAAPRMFPPPLENAWSNLPVERCIDFPATLGAVGQARNGIFFDARDLNLITVGDQRIQLDAIEQLFEKGQVNTIAVVLSKLFERYGQASGQQALVPLTTVMADVDQILASSPMMDLTSGMSKVPRGFLSRVRRSEVTAALNRMRTLRVVIRRP